MLDIMKKHGMAQINLAIQLQVEYTFIGSSQVTLFRRGRWCC